MPSVTLALLWAIEPPLPEAYDGIQAQGDYPVIEVANVFPMSVAFNTMIRRATTPYVVQVDQDVALAPGAVAKLVAALDSHPWRYAAWGQLYEEGFGLGGAVRCWRREACLAVPFRDVRCVDRDLHRRMRWRGWRRLKVEDKDPFGIHKPRMTPFAKFAKAKGDVQKWMYLGRRDLVRQYLDGITTREEVTGAAIGLCEDPSHSKDLSRDWKQFQEAFGGEA